MTFRLSWLSVLLVLFLCSCTGRATSPPERATQIRILRTCIIVDHAVDVADALALVAEANTYLLEQTGIVLQPVMGRKVDFPSRARGDVLDALYKFSSPQQDQFDLSIGFIGRTPGDLLKRAVVGDWMGLIDDTYRRYIVIKEMDKRVLVHEVYHAFILEHGHSNCGIMSPLLELFPGVPMNYSMTLCEKDRAEVLRNKNRPLGSIQEARLDLGKDTIR